jgi:hypothetical protein
MAQERMIFKLTGKRHCDNKDKSGMINFILGKDHKIRSLVSPVSMNYDFTCCDMGFYQHM